MDYEYDEEEEMLYENEVIEYKGIKIC